MSVNWFFLVALNHQPACSRAAELSRHLTRLVSNKSDRDGKGESLWAHPDEEIVATARRSQTVLIGITFCAEVEQKDFRGIIM